MTENQKKLQEHLNQHDKLVDAAVLESTDAKTKAVEVMTKAFAESDAKFSAIVEELEAIRSKLQEAVDVETDKALMAELADENEPAPGK